MIAVSRKSEGGHGQVERQCAHRGGVRHARLSRPAVVEAFAGVDHIIHAGDIMDAGPRGARGGRPGHCRRRQHGRRQARQAAQEVAGKIGVVRSSSDTRKRLLKRLTNGKIEASATRGADLIVCGYDLPAVEWVDGTLYPNPVSDRAHYEDDDPTVAVVESGLTGLDVRFVRIRFARTTELIPFRPRRAREVTHRLQDLPDPRRRAFVASPRTCRRRSTTPASARPSCSWRPCTSPPAIDNDDEPGLQADVLKWWTSRRRLRGTRRPTTWPGSSCRTRVITGTTARRRGQRRRPPQEPAGVPPGDRAGHGRRLDLGPWQAVFYCEFDGRRCKRLIVKVLGE